MKYVHSMFDRDRKVVEAVIRKFGPVSQVMINELTDIRPTTVSLLVRHLLDEGRVIEVGRSNNPVGRKQVLLLPNQEFRFVSAVAFDDEVIQAGVLDLHPQIRHTVTEKIPPRAGRDDLVQQLLSCTRRAVAEAGLTFESVLGVGISDPGLVDTRAGATVMSSTIPYWKDVPLKAIFEKELAVPAFLESSTRSKTLAEQMLGAGKSRENILYIDYGSGIGAGIVVEGKLVYGARGAAGEFGHTHVIEGGPVCSCGSYGCLEAIAGTRAVEAKLRRAIAEGGTTGALKLVGGDLRNLTGWTVLHGAELGDKLCGHIVAELANYLGVALANLVNLFDPSVVVLDRRLKLGGAELLGAVVQTMRRHSLGCSTEKMELHYAEFGDEGSLLGAALVVTQAYFEIPVLKPPRYLREPQLGIAGA
jgi:N-acetylglucosamine repressor